MDGASIWAGDGIYLTSNTTRVAALKMMAYILNGSEPGEPAYKRARLELVILVQSTPQQAAKTAKPAPPPPPPRPVPPPLWLSGQLPANKRVNSQTRCSKR